MRRASGLLLALAALLATAVPARALVLTPILSRHGSAAGDRYGAALAGPGDVDRDGRADLLVGAPGASANTGRAELLRGGGPTDTIPALVMTGEAAGDRFGETVVALGDLDGDGWRDWAVGAPGAAGGAGRVYVFRGGATLSTTPAWVITGAPGDSLGMSLAGGGDVDGDGAPELAAGAPGVAGGVGRVRLYRGGAAFDDLADLVMSGPPNVGTGRSVSLGSDLDHDGRAELVYGEPDWRGTAGSADGRVRAVFGSAALDTSAIAALTGYNGYGEGLGLDLGAPGDLDGDGRDDLIVAGRYYLRVFLGTAARGFAASISIGSRVVAHERGRLSSGIPWEILVANPDQYGTGGTPDGVVFVFGFVSASTSLHQYFYGQRSEHAGVAVSWLGDFDGDGVADMVASGIGAGAPAGRVTVRGLAGFTLLHPIGAERLAGLAPDSIVWRGKAAAHVEASVDGGRRWTRVASLAGGLDTNRVAWTPPDTSSSSVLVRVRSGVDSTYLEGRDAVSGYLAITRAYLLAPAGNTGGVPGRPLMLKWLASGPVDLEHTDAARWVRDATAFGTAGRCSLTVALPDSEPAYLQYRIVRSGENPAATNTAQTAGLVVKRVAFRIPTGSEQWASGTSHVVEWTSPGPADLDWSVDDGANWTRLASGLPATANGTLGGVGRTNILVPAADSVPMRFRVTFTGDSLLPSTSAISNAVVVRHYEFTDLGPLRWYAGDTGTLAWVGAGAADLDLSVDGGASWTRLLTAVAAGVQSFRLPGAMIGQALVRLTATGVTPGGRMSTYYQRPIVIQRFRLLVLAPLWFAGDTLTVRWLGASRADLDLSFDAGRSWWPLGRDVGGADDNALLVTLPLARADSAYVRVSPAGGGGDPVVDVSVSLSPSRVIYHQIEAATAPTGEHLGLSPVTLIWRGMAPADVLLSFDGTRWLPLATGAGGRSRDTLTVTLPDTCGGGARLRLVRSGHAIADSTSAAWPGTFVVRSHQLLSPNGGETWDADSVEVVRFLGRAPADVELSQDGGRYWVPLRANVGGEDDNRVEVLVPELATARARVRVRRAGRPVQDFGADTSATLFTVRYGDVPYNPSAEVTAVEHGEGANHAFGYTLANVGDYDGDGLDDVGVGCNAGVPGLTGVARVYLFPGSGGPRRVLEGRYAEQFGLSFASAGDFNGDGWDDVVVGAPKATRSLIQTGRALVCYGGPAADSLEDLSLDLSDLGSSGGISNFGWAVAGVGDMNGDGWDDIAVGNSAGSTSTGRVTLYLGGPGADGRVDLVFQPFVAGFGSTLAAAGDVNGDGYRDLLVGAPLLSGGNQGVRLFLGGPSVSPFPALTITPPGTSVDQFGIALAGLGDIDGDGYDDFAVGSPYDPVAGANTGRVFIHLGGPHPDATPDLILSGGAANTYFGNSLASLRDYDGDGWPDLLVGAYRANTYGQQSGRAYLFALGPGPSASPLLTLDGQAPFDLFGSSVCSAGDRDGDGRSEFAVGAPGRDVPSFTTGEARFYQLPHLLPLAPKQASTFLAGSALTLRWTGTQRADVGFSSDGGLTWTVLARSVGGADTNSTTITLPDLATRSGQFRLSISGVLPQGWNASNIPGPFRLAHAVPRAATRADAASGRAGESDGERLGGALATVGDWDGDGLDDVAAACDPADPSAPRLRVLLSGGGSRALAAPGAAARLGVALGAWDIDGDGAPDVVAGDPHDDGTPGRVLAWRGGADRDSAPDLVWSAPTATGGSFGSALAAGDLDGDGALELAVGMPDDTSGGGQGRAVLLKPPGPGVWRTLAGRARGERFGAALASGDFDLDGLADLAVGAPAAARNVGRAGRVDVFLAPGQGHALPDLSRPGEQSGEGFGAVLAVPGDLDGDGGVDLVVGAPQRDGPAGADAGRVSVMLSRDPFDLDADLVIEGARAGAWTGLALAGGDVDGDGFADLMVGAPFDGADGRGAARVYLGDVVPDATADATLTGERGGERLGVALTVRRRPDGLADALAGAPLADREAGRVRVLDWWRYRLGAPAAGTRWLAGSLRGVTWAGAEPAEVELSTDAGATWSTLASGAGGADSNRVDVRVPGVLGEARVRVRPSRAGLPGIAESVPFAIDRTVALGSFGARATDDGVALDWSTDPPLGPAGVAGYRLARRAPGASDERTVGPDPLLANAWVDPDGAPGSTYTLHAVDGTGTTLTLGSVTVEVALGGLVAWPVPARRGEPVRLTFVAPTDASGRAPADLDVSVYDVAGRRVATLAHGALATTVGRVRLTWPASAPAGLYFLRVEAPSARYREDRRIVLAR